MKKSLKLLKGVLPTILLDHSMPVAIMKIVPKITVKKTSADYHHTGPEAVGTSTTGRTEHH